MRHYETTIIMQPNLPESEVEAIVTGVEKELAERFSGQNLVVNRWGKRPLAYPIRKYSEGYYVLYEYDSEDENSVSGLEGRLRINEGVMRFLTVRRDEELQTEAKMKARFIKRRKHSEDDDSDMSTSYSEDDSED
jgi:small subunit ribosomal protein S6